MNLLVLANLAVFGLTLGFLYQRRKGGASIASNVLLAVLLGVILGALLQTAYGLGHAAIGGTLTWVGVVGGIIPDDDAEKLRSMGVAAVYTPKDFELNRIMLDIVTLVDRAPLAAE